MNLTVISFYTPDWNYPKYAAQLKIDCSKLGIDYHIVEKTSTNSYVGNCQMKAFFIKECLERFKSPVLWIDADASLTKSPDLLLDKSIQKFDIAGNRPANSPHRVHVGSIWFNYTDLVKQFVDEWCAEIENKKPLDDAAFNGVWDLMKDEINFFALPPEYFYILRTPDDTIFPDDTVIVHRLSCSELKMSYKNSIEKR